MLKDKIYFILIIKRTHLSIISCLTIVFLISIRIYDVFFENKYLQKKTFYENILNQCILDEPNRLFKAIPLLHLVSLKLM